ncbi:hypothetical protein [Streptomyces sp. NPDC006551]|uniref:hypothetical protein n=1 Tax=Streptomyces sp. NPDC006551 TaxID=3157178 RepID=UPI0033BF9BE0
MRYVRRAALAAALTGSLLVPMLPAAAADPAAVPDLRADVNRDGTVSTAPGADDDCGEDRWSTSWGAVFLPNIDDDSRRCPRSGDAASRACSDATDRTELPEVPEGKRVPELDRLRTPPVKSTGTGMVRAMERVEEISAFALGRVNLSRVPVASWK